DVIRPYIDGLDAPLVVKSQTEGIAAIARDPETQEIIPDHDTRMKAATHLVNLHGGFPRSLEMPAPPSPGLTVIISQDGGDVQVNQQTNNLIVDRTKIQPTGTSNGDREPKVEITQEP